MEGMKRVEVHGKWPNCKQNFMLMMCTLVRLELFDDPIINGGHDVRNVSLQEKPEKFVRRWMVDERIQQV